MPGINFSFIAALEGGQRLEGYVPAATSSQSGVTIATGFDLGARNATDLRALGLSAALVTKLEKYLGKKAAAAESFLKKNPLNITKAEADAIDAASKRSAAESVTRRYNQVVSRVSHALRFEQLSSEAQTVIASVAFQYGDLGTRAPNFWRCVTEQNWTAACNELRSFGDKYPTRRMQEADLLQKIIKSGSSAGFDGFTLASALGFGAGSATAPTISGSVGKGGRNLPADVRTVQRLLNPRIRSPYRLLAVDGLVDSHMINMIAEFQRRVLGFKSPDGLVGANGRTWRALLDTASNESGGGGSTSASSLVGPDWMPPLPSFSAPTTEKAEGLFGKFLYDPDPVAGNAENIKIRGTWKEENIITVTVPQIAKVIKGASGKAQIHRNASKQFLALWAAWEKAGLLTHVISYGGTFCARFQRGSKKLSNHSWGAAFDINMDQNKLGETPAPVGAKGSLRELVPLANQHGFYWGGHYKNRKDGMHFEVAVLTG